MRALLVEESDDAAQLLYAELARAGYEVTSQCVHTVDSLRAAMSGQDWDVVIADYNLPHFPGWAVVGEVRSRSLDLPIIVVSEAIGEDAAAEAMKAGAHDFVLKSNLTRLVPAIRRELDAAEVRRTKRIAELALHESEERALRLAENAQDVIYRYSYEPRRGFSYVSGAVTRFVGYSPEELYADPDLPLKIVHPDDQKLVEDLFCHRKVSPRLEIRWRHRDGQTVWTDQRIVALYDSTGTPVAIEGISRDISDLKRVEGDLRQSLDQLRNRLVSTVRAMALTVEMRDPYISGHQRRVANLAAAMASGLGFSEERADLVWLAGAIHDVGKINVPAEILSRPGPINEFEFALIKPHPQTGAELLKTIDFPQPIASIVHQHHERMDGSGYPLGLSGAQILPEARILAVADVVEAMSSRRPYRPALGIDRALAEITAGSGTRYDSAAVEACKRLLARQNHFGFE